MAYNEIYQQDFYQHNKGLNNRFRVRIYKDSHGGGVTNPTLSTNPVVIDRMAGDLMQTIRGSECTITFQNDGSHFDFEGQFADANYGDFYVQIYEDPSGANTLIWQGYNIPDTYTEPYDGLPYQVNVKFNCGLAHLKFEKFYNAGTLFDGRKHILEVIRLCLNQLPEQSNIGQNIRESINIYEDSLYGGSATTIQSMINSIYVDVGMYKDQKDSGTNTDEEAWSCYDVLTTVLETFHAQIYSYNGLWYIEPLEHRLDNTQYYREFVPAVGTESTTTVNSAGSYQVNKNITAPSSAGASDIVNLPGGELTPVRPLNYIRTRYNTQNIDFENNSLIKNGCFRNLNGTVNGTTNGYPTEFTFTNVNETTYKAMLGPVWNPKEGKTVNWFQFDPSVQTTAGLNDIIASTYIEQTRTNVPTVNTDKLRISFEFQTNYTYTDNGNPNPTALHNFLSSGQQINFIFRLQLGTYYLSGDPATGYSWTTTASDFIIWNKGSGKGSQNTGGNSAQDFWRDGLDLLTPTLPQSGAFNMTFRMYLPRHNYSYWNTANTNDTLTLDNIYTTCLRATYVPSGTIPPQTEIILDAIIDEEERVFEFDFKHGDGPTAISQGSFRLSDDSITDAWYRRGISESQTIHDIWLDTLAKLRGDYKRRVRMTLTGEMDFFNVIQHTVNAVTTRYMITSVSWNIETSMYDCELLEIADSGQSFTATTGGKHTDISLFPTSGGSGGTQSGQNGGGGGNPSTQRIGNFGQNSQITNMNQGYANNFV